MSLFGDTSTLFLREMLIFKKNLRVNLIRSLIFPILFVLLLGSFGSTPKNVPVAVVNYDNGAGALNFINILQRGNGVAIASQTNQQEATTLLSEGKVAAIVVIPTGFSSGLDRTVYVYLDNSQPQSSAIAASVVNSAAEKIGASASSSAVPGGGASLVSVVSNYVYGASSNYLSFVVGGILIMVASFGAVFTSGFTLLSDRELGNLKAFLTTPINKFSILLSKIAYGTFQSFLSAFIGLIIGLLYGATIAAGALGFLELIWVIFLVGLGFSALAIALAARMKQLQTYALIAQTLTLPLSFLAGAFVPVSLLPNFLQPIVEVNPLFYAVNAVRDIMIKGSLPVSTLVSTSVILLFFTGVMVVLAYVFFNSSSKKL